MMDSDDGPCTDCWDTGLTTQTERPCSCDAGDQHRAKPAPPMTDNLVGRLRERMAAASQQPWVYRPNEHDDWGFIRGVERDDKGIGPFRPVVAIARDSMVRTQQENEHREAGTDPYGPNALLIVDAVNSLPALSARIEALEAENADMAWLSTQRRLSLDFYSPMYGDDDDQSEEWRVTQESGSINDREWDVIGRGDTVFAAVAAARAALTPEPPHAD